MSSEGIAFLQEHDAYVQIHKNKNRGVSWQKYDRYAKPGQDYLSTMWIIFNTNLNKSKSEESRNLYYYLYSILMEQGKRSDALEMLRTMIERAVSGTYDEEQTNKKLKAAYNKFVDKL